MTESASDFIQAIERNLEGLRVAGHGPAPDSCPYCEDWHSETDPEHYEPAEFSTSQCDSCGTRQGGSRMIWHAFNEAGEIYHLDFCEDCACFHANGDEPQEWGR